MVSSDPKKLILVIGATGAQGLRVINALLAPSPDGTPSPYAVRAFTRNPQGQRSVELASKGIEVVQGMYPCNPIVSRTNHDARCSGSQDDFASVAAAFQGVYGAWVNTDGFTVGEAKETWEGIRIFELAKQAGVRHYIWSNLDYISKVRSRQGRSVRRWLITTPSLVDQL